MKSAGPNTDFAQLLRRCRAGEISRADALTAVDVIVHQPGADTAAMLEILAQEDRRSSLPVEFVLALLRQLNASREGIDATDVDVTWYGGAEATHTVAATLLVGEAQAGPPESDPEIGRVLKGRFELLERLGHGGMSTVYKAIDRRKSEALLSEPNVAVKVIRADLAQHPDMFAVLQRETHKVQSLGHPNIVRVFDCDRCGATVFMTMEYLEGTALSRRLSSLREGLPKNTALAIIEAIGDALAFAHRNGVVHGDLKPGNVIITDAGEVKVIDFGVARVLPYRSARTTPSQGTGERALSAVTPAYASPEMLENKEPDPRDDVYALACVAYTLLTGHHPFHREPATLARDANLHPAPDRKLTHAQYEALVAALAFERERRTPTVGKLIAGLRPRAPVAKIAGLAAGTVAVAAVAAGLALRSNEPSSVEPAAALTPSSVESDLAFRDCADCPGMQPVPAGSFMPGAASSEGDGATPDSPGRLVTFAAPFAVGQYEVTVREYAAFAVATARESAGCDVYDGDWHVGAEFNWRDAAYAQGPSHPVTCVSWDDAAAYASWLSAKTGHRYRLPSASEWEYAARGGPGDETDARPACRNGNVADRAAAERYGGWTVHACSDGYVYTSPVGSFAPSAFGLYDTLGNVSEWTADCWHADNGGAPADGSVWEGGDCSMHELRGGSWFTEPRLANGVSRNRFAADYRGNSFGFRIARDIAQ